MCKSLIKSFFFYALTLGLLTQAGMAASLQVSPTYVNFNAKEQAQSVWLTNSGTDTIRGQVRLYNWQQNNGQETLSQANQLIATPAVVTIKPGEKQLIRLVQPKQPSTSTAEHKEQAYRLLVNELPTPAAHAKGLQFLLSYSIPVFVNQHEDNKAQTILTGVSFSLDSKEGKAILTVDNKFNRHIKLSQLTFTPTSGKSIAVTPGLLGYTLAGQTMQWTLDLSASIVKGGGVLSAMVNNDTKPQILPTHSS